MSQEVRHPQFDLPNAASLLQTVSLESWEYSEFNYYLNQIKSQVVCMLFE